VSKGPNHCLDGSIEFVLYTELQLDKDGFKWLQGETMGTDIC
jgi:hypothetical protein